MWYTFLTAVHIFSCFFLVIVVLLQTGKGADIGAVFGGSSQTVFGSSGAGNFLSRLTTAIAALFMLTSLTLTYGAAQRTTRSLFDTAPISTPAPEPSSEQGAVESSPLQEGTAPPTETSTPGTEEQAASGAPPSQAEAEGTRRESQATETAPQAAAGVTPATPSETETAGKPTSAATETPPAATESLPEPVTTESPNQ